MKKSTKILIATTTIASVIGVGAVSYAAWTASEAQKQEVSGTTGSVRTVGDITVTPSSASGKLENGVITMNSLYPVDQGDGFRTYWEFTVSATVTDDEQAPTFTLKGELSASPGGPEVTNAKLYWSAAQPTATIGAVEANELSTPKAITLSADNKVYVYMVATGTDAMKANITLTFSAS